MQESTTSLDPSGSGLLPLERDRVKAQEKIQNIYDKKTKPTVWNSITKTEFLPTIYDVPAPAFLFSSPIIEGARGRGAKGGGAKGVGAKGGTNNPTDKGKDKMKAANDKMNSKADAAKSKIMGPMQKVSEYTKAFFLSFAKIITVPDRNEISSLVKQSNLPNMQNLQEASKIIPNTNPESNTSTNNDSETNTKTKKELKAEPTEPRKEKFETIENMEEDTKAAVDTKELENAKEEAEKKVEESKNKMNSLIATFFNQHTNLSEAQIDQHNADLLYGVVYEFILLCLSYVITYNIYYFSFIYKWDVKTAHYDPEQGFLFGGVFKSMVDDWLMRDIRYPMLFMGYFYSWLIPGFFRFIGVIRYPKLCFIIILLHTMVITFTQGANAAMSVDRLLGGSPMSFVLLLNILSCLGAFFNTSLTAENALAWVRFYALLIPSIISNLIRLLIAFFGVFISQFMVYFFFIYTTSGLGLLWESQIFGIGDTIAEINNHIDGNSTTDKNYCKGEGNASALWDFINTQIEPNFPFLFRILCIIFVVVKVIVIGLSFIGFSAKILLMIFIVFIPMVILWIMDKISASINGSDKQNNTVIVSSKEPRKSLKELAQNMSEKRSEYLTRKSNEANQMLSEKLGQPLRDIRNKLSDNVVSRTILGDNTFTSLLPEDKKNLQEITKELNDIMTNIDFAKDKDGKQAEEDVKSLLTTNVDMYETLQHILQQPNIQQHIANRIGKGKRMPEILQHMFKFILSQSGANPQVSELVSNILSYQMDYGNEEEGDPSVVNPTVNPNEITLDFIDDNKTPTSPPIVTPTPLTKNPTNVLSDDDLQEKYHPRVTTTASPVTKTASPVTKPTPAPTSSDWDRWDWQQGPPPDYYDKNKK